MESIEVILAVIISGIFFLIGLGVQIMGTNYADKRNHKRNLERLRQEHDNKIDYMRKEIFYKKKLEYCEILGKKIEETKNNMYKMIKEIKEDKIPEISYLLGEPSYMEYSLIFKTINLLDKIKEFKGIQKEFGDQMIKTLKSKEDKNKYIEELQEIYLKIDNIIFELSYQMRRELKL